MKRKRFLWKDTAQFCTKRTSDWLIEELKKYEMQRLGKGLCTAFLSFLVETNQSQWLVMCQALDAMYAVD